MNNSELTESEAKIQSDCYLWFHNNFKHLRGLLYHVPNGEKRDPVTAKKLQAMGLVPGVPDIVFHFKGNTYFMEFKKPKTGRVSDDQKKVHKILEDHNFMIWQVESLGYFINLIQNIVERKNQLFTAGTTKEDYFYRHKIFSYLYSLGDAELVKLEDLCEDSTRAKFIHYVSEFMNENFDLLDDCDILFTPDFEAIYKKKKGSEREVIYKGSAVVQDF